MLKVVFHPQIQKDLLKIPKDVRSVILDKIAELEKLSHPLQHRRVIKLKGKIYPEFRLRVGNYRIKLVFIEPNIVKIVRIKHRQFGYPL